MAKESDRVAQSGALANSAALIGRGLTSSLSDLSNIFGRQAAAEEDKRRYELGQERADKIEAESARRFKLTDDRDQKEADYKYATREAKKALGDFITGGGVESTKFTLEDNTAPIQERLTGERKRLLKGKESLENFLRGDYTPETLKAAMSGYKSSYAATGDAAADKDAYANREADYIALAEKLKTVSDPKAREDLITDMSNKVYAEPLQNLQKDIDTGRYLLKGERENAIIRRLPRAMQHLGREYVLGELGDSAGGLTKKELLASERQRVSDFNKAGLSQANKNAAAYASSLKKGGGFKSADFKNLTEHLANIDIGKFDNARVLDAANHMLDMGHHPAAIATVIHSNIAKGIIDDSFISEGGDKKLYDAMISQSKTMSDKMYGSGTGRLPTPSTFRPTVDRSLDQIRIAGFQRYRQNKLGEGVQRTLPAPAVTENIETTAENVVLPDTTKQEEVKEAGTNPYYRDVPEGDDFIPSEDEQEYYRKKKEKYDSLGATIPRVAEDVYDAAARSLPPTLALGSASGVNMLRSLGNRIPAFVRPINKAGAKTRADLSKIMRLEDAGVKVAAKQAALKGKPQTAAAKAANSKRAASQSKLNEAEIQYRDMWRDYAAKVAE